MTFILTTHFPTHQIQDFFIDFNFLESYLSDLPDDPELYPDSLLKGLLPEIKEASINPQQKICTWEIKEKVHLNLVV